MIGQRLQITLEPGVLRWARERAKLSRDDLARKMQVKSERVLEWENSGNISIAQVKRLAGVTYTPHGYLYLYEPPDESLPIADFRTIGDEPLRRPSPDLLDTVYSMQRRQAWMREELVIEYESPALAFVGRFTSTDDPKRVADAIRETLRLDHDWASYHSNWEGAQRYLRDRIESAGVLLVINGVVGNNTYRKLDSEEFRGFALVDEYAPLIFVNNADYKTAQMFTLAHELAHIFVGEAGVSAFEDFQPSAHDTEQLCNLAAAEFLVPERELQSYWNKASQTHNSFFAIARQFKVSSIVAARRALDLKLIGRDEFFAFYNEHNNNQRSNSQENQNGGDFWATQKWRVGPRFATAVVRAVKEGRLTYKEAYSLTGLKGDTFENLSDRMGIQV